MQQLGKESIVGKVIQPYRNGDIAVTILGERSLFIGIEEHHDGRKFLTIFTKHDKGVCEVDTLYFWNSKGTSEKDKRRKLFQWGEFSSNHRMTREQAKERLRSLGFDPNMVDVVYPTVEGGKKS